MTSIMHRVIPGILLFLASLGTVAAVPALQLDISGGQYDLSTETITNTTNQFSLYGLVNNPGVQPYYVAVAVTPRPDGPEPKLPGFGSFSIDGTTYTTDNFTYGTPSVGGVSLPSHGIYPTYYFTLSVNTVLGDSIDNFDGFANVYNTEDDPGGFSTWSGSGKKLSYESFLVDVTNLGSDYEIHFDFFTGIVKGNKVKIQKAPFSHDAGAGTKTPVPDGGTTLLLLGLGTMSLTLVKRRLSYQE